MLDKATIAGIKGGSVRDAINLCNILMQVGRHDAANRVRNLLREVGQAEDHQHAVRATLALRNAMESIIAELEAHCDEE